MCELFEETLTMDFDDVSTDLCELFDDNVVIDFISPYSVLAKQFARLSIYDPYELAMINLYVPREDGGCYNQISQDRLDQVRRQLFLDE